MNSWEEQQFFAGLDWASDHHDLSIVDRKGQVKTILRFSHDSEGWAKAREALKQFGSAIPVAVETCHGMAIEQL